jgi:hypothetical protein
MPIVVSTSADQPYSVSLLLTYVGFLALQDFFENTCEMELPEYSPNLPCDLAPPKPVRAAARLPAGMFSLRFREVGVMEGVGQLRGLVSPGVYLLDTAWSLSGVH